MSMRALVDDVISVYQAVYNLYRCASQSDDKICYRSPPINSLFEHFDRIELMTELSNAAFKKLGINLISCNVPDNMHYECVYSMNDPKEATFKKFENKSISFSESNAQSCDCDYSVKKKRERAPRHAGLCHYRSWSTY